MGASEMSVNPIHVAPMKEFDTRVEHEFALPVGDVLRPSSVLSSPKDADNTTHRFSVDIYKKDVKNIGKAEIIPTSQETTELPLVPGANISQKKEAEFVLPIGIVPAPADKLQEPTEGKEDSQTFGADLYMKDNLEETSEIDQYLENIPIGLPSYKEKVSKDIYDFPEPSKVGSIKENKNKDIPTLYSLSPSMKINPPKDTAVAVVDIPKDPYNTEDLSVKSLNLAEE